jgi:hypothetical protein
MPAATRAAALTGRILPSSTPIVVMTTIRGKPVAAKNAKGTSWYRGRSPRWSSSAGAPRTTRNSTRKSGTRRSPVGVANRACRSNCIPLTMKKIGTRKPNPIASSFPLTIVRSSPWTKSLTTMPAANAPSSTSRPRRKARNTRARMRSTEIRTGSWTLEWTCRCRNWISLGGCGLAANRAAATATTTNTNSRTDVVSGLRRSRSTATARMGANSPTLPIDITRAPKRPSNRPASRSIGNSVPRAVVVRARPITMASSTVPITVSAVAISSARASEIIHPVVASFRDRPRMRGRSSSSPARNIRYDSPISSRATMTLSGWAMPRTAGPITMPRTISNTTSGIARRPVSSARMGEITATIPISTSVASVESVIELNLR